MQKIFSVLSLGALLTLGAAQNSTAQQSGFAAASVQDGINFYAGAQTIYEDNLFRLPAGVTPETGGQRSDQILRLDAGVSTRARFGLQSVSLEVSANRSAFSNNDFLNYTGNNALINWDWQIGSNFSGDLGYTNRRTLTNFGDQRRETRDLTTVRGPRASGNVKVALDHLIGIELSDIQTRRSDPLQSALGNDVRTVGVRWAYRSTAEGELGVRVRRAEADYPDTNLITPNESDFTQDELLASASGAVGAVSRWTAEGGYAKRSYSQTSTRDYSGAIGRVKFDWQPTVKTDISIGLSRQVIAPEELDVAYSLSTLGSITATWAAAQSISLRFLAERDRRDYEPAQAQINTAGDRRDTLNRIRLSASYAPITALRLTAGVENGERKSTLTDRTYRYYQIQLGAEGRF
jgi:exopolysaccharide biosynthesis operon protein EpsL